MEEGQSRGRVWFRTQQAWVHILAFPLHDFEQFMSSLQISFLICKIRIVMPLGGIIVWIMDTLKCPPEGAYIYCMFALCPLQLDIQKGLSPGILLSFSAGRNRRVERMCDMPKIPHMWRDRALITTHAFLIPSPVLSPEHQGKPRGAKQGSITVHSLPLLPEAGTFYWLKGKVGKNQFEKESKDCRTTARAIWPHHYEQVKVDTEPKR